MLLLLLLRWALVGAGAVIGIAVIHLIIQGHRPLRQTVMVFIVKFVVCM